MDSHINSLIQASITHVPIHSHMLSQNVWDTYSAQGTALRAGDGFTKSLFSGIHNLKIKG